MKSMNQNTLFSKSVVVLSVVYLLITLPALGDYNLSWYTIDGGGRTSSGGQYVLTGTIGQPDAGYSAGGSYEFWGGFWPGGPLCFVEFDDFARFAQQWLEDDVDLYDLKEFTDYWLCICPYDWPWK
jgi:hypothetical protein